MAVGSYCREVESYLCRRNEGHLIRIIGPAFDLVRGWEVSEIPLSVVYQAIDRTVERREAKGGRRRPVRIEFCEADVLDLFDDWRRAVGVSSSAAGREANCRAPRPPSLVTHVDRGTAALTAWGAAAVRPAALRDLAAQIVSELDRMHAAAKTARGETRQRLLARLQDIDRELVVAAWKSADADLLDRLRAQAERELAPFRERMPPAEFARSLKTATDRLLGDHLGLPRVVFR